MFSEEEELLPEFDVMVEIFERTVFKVKSSNFFIEDVQGKDALVLTKSSLMHKFGNLTCSRDGKRCNFLTQWLKNYNDQRSFDMFGSFPVSSLCPPNCFNTWRPFELDSIVFSGDFTVAADAALREILDFISILCGRQQDVNDYFLKWIAHMIQHPEQKPATAPIFLSRQGGGKGTLVYFLEKLIGVNKVLHSSNPGRELWGQFNQSLESAFLIHIDELHLQQTSSNIGQFQALVSEPTLMINGKGMNPHRINSYHRFIVTTDQNIPIPVRQDERRFVIIRSSDDLVGNKEYFAQLRAKIDCVEVMKYCYDYFKNLIGAHDFLLETIPQTPIFAEALGANKECVEIWLEELQEDIGDVVLKVDNKDLFERYKQFCRRTNNVCESQQQFFPKLKKHAAQLGLIVEDWKSNGKRGKDISSPQKVKPDEQVFEAEHDEVFEAEHDQVFQAENDQVFQAENEQVFQAENDQVFEVDNLKAFETEYEQVFQAEHDQAFEVNNDEEFETDHDQAFEADHDQAFEAEHDEVFVAEHEQVFEAEHEQVFEAEHEQVFEAEVNQDDETSGKTCNIF
jgi:hypothetical protein